MSEIIDKVIQFQGQPLVVTIHAEERLIERWPNANLPPARAVATIERLMSSARPDKLDPKHAVHRLINNGFEPAEYFHAEGWRFVVKDIDGKRTLVTVERRTRR